MALTRDRRRISVSGMGNITARQVSPSAGTAFESLGYLKSSLIKDEHSVDEIRDSSGDMVNVLSKQQRAELSTALLQSTADELNFLKNATGKVYALRHYGKIDASNRFQYFCFDQAIVKPHIQAEFKVGERLVPMEAVALAQDQLGYNQPLYYLAETNHVILIDGLQLWVEPRLGLNTESAKLLDISGFALHGTLNSDFAAIWQQGSTPAEFLRFDGVNDNCDWGDQSIAELDLTSDMMFEAWVRPQGADGTAIYIASKKAGTGTEVGWWLRRNTGNTYSMRFSDSVGNTVTLTFGTSILQNVWHHIAIVGDRDTAVRGYVDGVSAGVDALFPALGAGADSNPMYLGRVASTYGQIDIGNFRFYNFGANGLPSDIATTIANHYNAEKAFYGL